MRCGMLTKGAPATWGLRVQIDAVRGVELEQNGNVQQ